MNFFSLFFAFCKKKINILKVVLISSFYYTTHVYRQPLTLLFSLCRFLFMFLGDVCKLNKTPRDSTCLEEPPGGCCYCFTSLEVFAFPYHQHSTMGSQAREGLHQLWALFWLLSVALLLPGFSVKVFPRALRFWADAFYPQAFFTLHSFPTSWHVLWLRCGQEHPIQDHRLCLPSQSCPFWLTHGLELFLL